MFKKILVTTVIAIAGALFLFGYNINEKNDVIEKTSTNDLYDFIAINNVLMWISNNGDGSPDPVTDGNVFYWPGGRRATQSAIFEDGLLWGGLIDGEVRVGGSTYRAGLQAGKILPDGTADDPSLEKYRIYKIRKDFKTLRPTDLISQEEIDRYQRDYDEWPVEDGAPWVDKDGDGVFTRGVDSVQFVGDEVLWFVSNDLDENRTTFLYGTAPFGLEMQSTTFAFNKTGDLGDIVFKKYMLINKGSNTIEDMVLGYWSDTDLGDANDDFTGSDTNLVLGYTYNGTNEDNIYGSPPPAVGYDFFQGPIVPSTGDSAKFLGTWRQGFKNLGLTSFTLYINGSNVFPDPPLGNAQGSIEMYNYMTSKIFNGDPFIDPNTGQEVKYVVTGDPVRGIGWYEGDGWPGGPAPGDRRHLMSSGPFTMQPGDTQEVVVGIVIALGKDRLNSVAKLKRKDRAAQNAYDFDFIIPDSPPTPLTNAVAGDRKITLYWEDNAESYRSLNYSFEGYRIWQFPNELGSFDEAVLLGTYDIVNEVTEIFDLVALDDYNSTEVELPVVVGSDNGLIRKFDITNDQLSGTRLINDRDYYFGVTAYGYAQGGIPPVLESSADVQIVRPGANRIDVTYDFDNADLVMPRRVAGGGDPAGLRLQVVDPDSLLNATYHLTFANTNAGNLAYTFYNQTSGDTVYDMDTVFYSQPTGKIVDGFTLLVSNPGQDSLDASGLKSAIKSAEQITRGDGVELTNPINIVGSLSPNEEWRLLALSATELSVLEGKSAVLNAMNWQGNAGQDI